MKPVYIRWVDSMHMSGWCPLEEFVPTRRGMLHETVGFLARETPHSYVVVQSRQIDVEKKGQVDAIMEIPKVAVEKFRRLK